MGTDDMPLISCQTNLRESVPSVSSACPYPLMTFHRQMLIQSPIVYYLYAKGIRKNQEPYRD